MATYKIDKNTRKITAKGQIMIKQSERSVTVQCSDKPIKFKIIQLN